MCGPDRPGARRLTGRELLALQLLARGYAVRQVAALRGQPETDVFVALRSASASLGAATVPEAIAEAKRRGLID